MPAAARSTEADLRAALAARYARIRAESLSRASKLSVEDQAVQSMPDASPTKWHLAHTSWFFETFLLAPHLAGYVLFDARYGYLFNSYYEAEGPRHPRAERGLLSRPSLEDVHAYRKHVDAAMASLIASGDAAGLRPLIELGLAHEEQHQELMLMDAKHLLSRNPLRPAVDRPSPRAQRGAPPLEWRGHPGGLVEIGHEGEAFAFDNEGPGHKVYLEPFSIASRLATEAEYLAFIDDGGYRRPELWLAEGWALAAAEGWRAPLYWREAADGWRAYTLAGERGLEPGAPVAHLSFFEAEAFARWSGKRLPTEAEWEIAAEGLADAFGALWQWTASPYTPYPRYRPAAGAIGEYNGKFMCGQMTLRGSSSATPQGHARTTYRNFFPPAARWAFSGVRLAADG